MRYIFRRGMRIIRRIGRVITAAIIYGILINVVANHFYPDFYSRFPAIYGIYDGCLQAAEFILKSAFRVAYSLFDWSSNGWKETANEFKGLISQFVSWISSL